MPDAQENLTLFTTEPDDERVKWLEALLRRRPRWRLAASISRYTGYRLSDRAIRTLASASGWIISGQRGYKHLEHATMEEVNHAANWLEHQANLMGERARRLRVNSHRRIG